MLSDLPPFTPFPSPLVLNLLSSSLSLLLFFFSHVLSFCIFLLFVLSFLSLPPLFYSLLFSLISLFYISFLCFPLLYFNFTFFFSSPSSLLAIINIFKGHREGIFHIHGTDALLDYSQPHKTTLASTYNVCKALLSVGVKGERFEYMNESKPGSLERFLLKVLFRGASSLSHYLVEHTYSCISGEGRWLSVRSAST